MFELPIDINTPQEQLDDLIQICREYDVLKYTNIVLLDYDFFIWSGSAHPNVHHYGNHQLLQHTWEVVRLCILIALFYQQLGIKINIEELIVSAIWHDYGKIWDYEKNGDGGWQSSEDKYKIYHISRSVFEFRDMMSGKGNQDGEFSKNVTHNILAHHGRNEWKSPVTPVTKEAWILHLCDGISARVNDCDMQFQSMLSKLHDKKH